ASYVASSVTPRRGGRETSLAGRLATLGRRVGTQDITNLTHSIQVDNTLTAANYGCANRSRFIGSSHKADEVRARKPRFAPSRYSLLDKSLAPSPRLTGRMTPRSVTIPAITSAGVTSNAGL